MSNFIFLKETQNTETTYFAISTDKIKTLNLVDTYDNNGQPVSHYDAGDYHLDNSASDATKDLKAAIAEKFGIEAGDFDIVEGDDDDFVIETDEEADTDAINSFITAWREENETLNTCKGFNYWDGRNWQTIVLEAEGMDWYQYEILEDEALVAELNAAIEDKEYSHESYGKRYYEAGNWQIIDSAMADAWETYEVREKVEAEA